MPHHCKPEKCVLVCKPVKPRCHHRHHETHCNECTNYRYDVDVCACNEHKRKHCCNDFDHSEEDIVKPVDPCHCEELHPFTPVNPDQEKKHKRKHCGCQKKTCGCEELIHNHEEYHHEKVCRPHHEEQHCHNHKEHCHNHEEQHCHCRHHHEEQHCHCRHHHEEQHCHCRHHHEENCHNHKEQHCHCRHQRCGCNRYDFELVSCAKTKCGFIIANLVVDVIPATYSAVGEIITYNYTVYNLGTALIEGRVIIRDSRLGDLVFNNAYILPTGNQVFSREYTITNADLQSTKLVSRASAVIPINKCKAVESNDVCVTINRELPVAP